MRRLRDRLDEAELDATMIIAGLDVDVGHIYLIDDPGDYICCDSEAFAAIGLGRQHAQSVFTEAMYTDITPWTEAVVLVYLAKKRAEAAPGVGRPDTDIYWIKADGYAYVAPKADLMRELIKIWHDMNDRMRRAIGAGHGRLHNAIENLPLAADYSPKEPKPQHPQSTTGAPLRPRPSRV